jgi:hypothetical protein
MNGFLHPKKEKLHPDGLEAQTSFRHLLIIKEENGGNPAQPS